MSDHEEGHKKGHKKFIAMLLAVGGTVFFLKKKKGSDEPGWEEAKPPSSAE